jgi:methylmalonyl-CoA mutase cobalamin-binding domain/chain
MVALEDLVVMLADLKEKEVINAIQELISKGEEPAKLLDVCQRGMELVGRRYETGEYFVADMLMAAEIFNKIMEMVGPKLEKAGTKHLGIILLGTVQNDIHDIGKNIAKALLEAAGFDVHDVGVDVPPEKFVEGIKKIKPNIVGLSCLLTVAFESMKKTIDAIKKAGLRDSVKIIIGGAPVTETVMRYVGADAYTTSAAEGVEICKRWVQLGE